MGASTVLVIDDDDGVRQLVVHTLALDGHRVVGAADGPSGIAAFREHQPDLVVLDVGLGQPDGLEVCRQIRAIAATPVLFVSGRVDEVDELLAFAAGGDDYVTKPFSIRILTARVQTMLRRASSPSPVTGRSRLEVGPIAVDTDTRVASVEGTELDLTRTEFDLLALLAEHPERVHSRSALLEQVWGEWYGDDHVVEVHLSRLRAKVAAASGIRVAKAVRGVGYKLGIERTGAST